MRSPRINGEEELRGQPANPGSPGKMAVKTECVFVCVARRSLFVLKVPLGTSQPTNLFTVFLFVFFSSTLQSRVYLAEWAEGCEV